MKNYKLISLIIISTIFLQFSIISDPVIDEIEEIFQKSFTEKLYVHTDKTVYKPGEFMYYKAYLETNTPSPLPGELNVLLIQPEGNIILNEKIKYQENFPNGKILIPKDVKDGIYSLVAFTDKMTLGAPANVFSKKIMIKNHIVPNFFIKLALEKTNVNQGEARVKIKLLTLEGKALSKEFNYEARMDGEVFLSGNEKTNKNGEYEILVNLPKESNKKLITFEVNAKISRNVETNSMIISQEERCINMCFSPEGGSLVDKIGANIYFRATDKYGNSTDVSGEIIDSNNTTLSHFNNLYKGIGNFYLYPQKNQPVKVKITQPEGITQLYTLPEIKPTGTTISLKSIDKENITLLVLSNEPSLPRMIYLVAEMKGHIYWYSKLNFGGYYSFKVPKQSFHKGIVNFYVFTETKELLAYRPVLLNNYQGRIEIESPRQEYATNEDVELSIVRDSLDVPIVEYSVSVTDSNRIFTPTAEPNILSSFYFNKEHDIELLPEFFTEDNDNYRKILDNCLLGNSGLTEVFANKIISKPSPAENFTENVRLLYTFDKQRCIIYEVEANQYFYKNILKDGERLPNNVYKEEVKNSTALSPKTSQKERIQSYLSTGKPILDVIKMLRTCQMENDQIFFRGTNSINIPIGAMIVLDGQKMGTSSSILNSISPYTVDEINIYTSPEDVLAFTGLNNSGIIEIKLKKQENNTNNSAINLNTLSEIIQKNQGNSTIAWETGSNPLGHKIIFNYQGIKTSYNIVLHGIFKDGSPFYYASSIKIVK